MLRESEDGESTDVRFFGPPYQRYHLSICSGQLTNSNCDKKIMKNCFGKNLSKIQK